MPISVLPRLCGNAPRASDQAPGRKGKGFSIPGSPPSPLLAPHDAHGVVEDVGHGVSEAHLGQTDGNLRLGIYGAENAGGTTPAFQLFA